MQHSPILLLITPEDLGYVHLIKPLLKGRPAFFISESPDTAAEVEMYASSQKIKYIICTNEVVLNKVVSAPERQSLKNWAGSLYEKAGITYLFLSPLKQFFSVTYGKFIAERFISKLTEPEKWDKTPEFTYEVATPQNIEAWYEIFQQKALVLAADIETKSFENPVTKEYETIIRCISYSALVESGEIYTFVIPVHEAPSDQVMFFHYWMRKFDALKIPKIFQNGLYDTSHLLTNRSIPYGYLWDTQSLFHSWYSELPKRLDFLGAFCVHNIFYWKDMAQSGGLSKLLEYNARDSWATLVIWSYLIRNMPDWAITNYLIKFPLWVPCLLSNLEGLKCDEPTRAILTAKSINSFESSRARLKRWLGDDFKPSSPQHVTKLIHFYGSVDIPNSDETALTKFSLRHPLNARFAREVLNLRGAAKAISTYFKPEGYSVAEKSNRKRSYLLKHGNIFYSLNPDGTDSGRLSCSEGYCWTGFQLQNIPDYVKEMLIPPPGFEFFELDGQTAESFTTGFISGDTRLLEALLSGKDFHATNAERFFGIPYDEIVKFVDGIKYVIMKDLRNLSKRTNHGATYNMQWFTLLNTMGEEAVDKAKVLLKLPSNWTRRRVTEYLLDCFDKAYPGIKGDYYSAVVNQVTTTHKLVSALGWTRYCFGNPNKSREDKNSYIAHGPQNLSVGVINEAYKDIFWKVIKPNHTNIRLKGQIHDSIFGAVRIGHRHLVEQARSICVRKVPVKDVHGITRVMEIPFSAKFGAKNWHDMVET